MALIVKIGANIDNFDKQMKKLTKDTKAIGEKFQSIGTALSAGLTLPIVALGTASVIAASQVDSAQATIQNSLGLTAEEAEKLTDSARGIYNDGFGESLDEVQNALIQTKQNIQDLNAADLEDITEKAMVLAKTFDADVNEVTRAGNNVMSGFGISAQEAFDLMAYGAQNGLNFSNEMFDNLSEYAPLFGQMGFSAEEYFQLLVKGSEAGVYNLDYINDVMKEFQIRTKDGSKTTSDAMAQLSSSTQQVWQDFLNGKGTVKDVSNAVLGELSGMDNQVLANQIGVALYGTKWEDLESTAMYALGGINGEIGNVDGTMQNMVDTQEQTFGQQFQSVLREAKDALVPLGEVFLDLAKNVLPVLKDAIKFISDAFSNMSPETKNLVAGLLILLAAIGPLLTIVGLAIIFFGQISAILGPLGLSFMGIVWPILAIVAAIAAVIAIFVLFWDEIKAGYETYFKPTIDAIIGYLASVLVPLFKQGWETLSDIVKDVFGIIVKLWNDILWPVLKFIISYIQTFVVPMWQVAFGIIASIVSNIFTTIGNLWNKTLKPIFEGIIDFISGVFSGNWEKAWDGIVSIFSGIWEGLKTAAKLPLNAVIAIINGAINGINSISVDIPDWVPKYGGRKIGFDIPKIPQLATGGNLFGSGAAIVGEAGPELVEKSGSSVKVTPLTAQEKAIGSTLGGSVTVQQMIVRDDYDIKLIARELFNLQKSASRRVGAF